MSSFRDRLAHAWNAFRDRPRVPVDYGGTFSYRPYAPRLSVTNERTVLESIKNRISIDCSAVSIRHVKTDSNGRYKEDVASSFNDCLTVEANADQSARAFRQDVFQTLLDEGVIAIVPVDTSLDPSKSDSYEINTMRVGKVTEWFADAVRVRLYNDQTGQPEELVLRKKQVAIVESPLYSVMNEPNSTYQRLVKKLALLDLADNEAAANKLDIIIQLPYVIKSEARRKEAETRRKEIEQQLTNAKYGVAYTDGTERITQLNRPAENTLLSQVEFLTKRLYTELGLTEEILSGTATETAMLNYRTRTVKPLVDAVVEEMRRKFLTKTARTRGHDLQTYSDPFALVPVSQIADIADKLTRNEILSPNELRSVLGFRPVDDKSADELRNRNMVLEDTQPATTG